LFQDRQRTFSSLGAFQPETFNLTGSEEPVLLEGVLATSGFFPAMGIQPAMGRWFGADEDRPGHEHVVVLSDRAWRERFGARRDIVGSAVELNGFSYNVVGVMPPGFAFPHGEEMPDSLEFPRQAQLWAPLAIAPGDRGPSELAVVGRLRPNTRISQTQAELDVFAATFERMFPTAKGWSRSRAVPLRTQIVGPSTRPLLLLLGAVGLVLLIVVSNIAGLVLTRALGRRREFDVRAALGAGRRRLIRQLLAENLLLAGSGGVLGVVLAEAGIEFVRRFGPASLPRLAEVSLDPAVLAFSVAITGIAGLLFGLAPGLAAARGNLADSLRAGARILAGQFSPRLRTVLLTGQIALAVMLTIAAGLLVRTFYGLVNTERGFELDHVLTFEISLPPAKYPDPERMAQVYSRALAALQELPGVQAAGLVHAVPMGGSPDATVIRVPGRTPKPNEQPYANYMFASPAYFAAVCTPLLQGRDFRNSDTLQSVPVAIVNRAMAEALWPGESAIGKQVGVATTKYPVRTVIGVVANVKQNSLREEPAPEMYVPFTQNEIKIWPPMQTMQVAVRTIGDPGQMTASLGEALHSVDADLPLAKVSTLTTLVDASLSQPRFAMLLLVGFGVLALILASVGMYGVIAHSVAQRTQEIGIRMVLGADSGSVFRMVLAQSGRLAAVGIAIGLAGAEVGTRTLAGYLYGVRAADPLTFVAVSVAIAGVALLAGYLPARRAARLDPAIALRQE